MLRKKTSSAAFPDESTAAGNPRAEGFLADEPGGELLIDNADGTVSDDVANRIAYALNPDPRNRGGFTFQEGRPPYKGKTLKVWNGDGSR